MNMDSYEALVHRGFGPEGPDVRDPAVLAWLIRRNGLEMSRLSRGSHIGSVFSAAEIIAVLYASVLRVEYARSQSFPLDWQLFWETIGGVFRKAENAAKEKKARI